MANTQTVTPSSKKSEGGFSLIGAQASAYALSIGVLLEIAQNATKLQQLNYENEKTVTDCQGKALAAYAESTKTTMTSEANALEQSAYGQFMSAGLQGAAEIGGSAYSKFRNGGADEISQKLNNVQDWEGKIKDVEVTPPRVQVNNGIQIGNGPANPRNLKAANVVTDRVAEDVGQQGNYGNALEDAYVNDRASFDETKASVRSAKEKLQKDERSYREDTQHGMQRVSSVGQAAGGIGSAAFTVAQANIKKEQAEQEAQKVATQFTKEAFDSAKQSSSQNGQNLQSSKDMVYRVMEGIAQNCKV